MPALIAGGLTVDFLNDCIVAIRYHVKVVTVKLQLKKDFEEQVFIVPYCQGALKKRNKFVMLLSNVTGCEFCNAVTRLRRCYHALYYTNLPAVCTKNAYTPLPRSAGVQVSFTLLALQR